MKQTGMRSVGMLLVLLFFLSIPVLTCAGEAFEYLSAGKLKELIELKAPGLMIIDSRSAHQYVEAHIKGAVNIPLEAMEQDAKLPNVPKDSWLVFYCSGTT